MTRTKTLLVGILALAGGAAVPAHATTTIFQQSFSGSQASIFLSTSTSITCADGSTNVAMMSAQVSGAQQIQSMTGTPQTISNGTSVFVFFYFNGCTGVSLFDGDGGIANSFTPPDNKLTSASMDGTGFVQDFDTGAQLALDVDVVMTGTGSTSSEKSNSHTKTTGTTHGNLSIGHSQSANSNRSATVSGTVTIDTVTFDASQPIVASLISNSSSSLTVSK